MSDIVMPRLSDTMEEGTILRWLKREGDQVDHGEELVEIETDKASMTYESDSTGVLELVAREGDTLPIGAVIARLQETPSATGVATGQVRAAPASADHGQDPEAQGRTPASPLARRVARESGVDLHGIIGSGPGGRVLRADVEAAAHAVPGVPTAPTPDVPEPTGQDASPEKNAPAHASGAREALPEVSDPRPNVATAKGRATVYELSRTQQLIARRMAEAKATIPEFTLEDEIDMQECVALRSELERHLGGETAQAAKRAAQRPAEHADTDPPSPRALGAPTYNDMALKACAIALREHPRVNASYRDGTLQVHARVNVGLAVAVQGDDPMTSSLVVPTVFDADTKSLGEIARTTRALAERVRAGTITPPELSGATFTISNLGMFGVRSFSAIINPPQAAIMSIGELAPRAVVRAGSIVSRHTMIVKLACDHRMLYGADGARFLARVRELLQTPAALML